MNKETRFWKILACLNFVLVLFCLSFILPSCSTNTFAPPGTNNQTPPDLSHMLIPAANILFRPNTAQAQNASPTPTPTYTGTIYADQVITSNAQTATESDNLQQYMEATDPILADILPGTWQVQYFYTETPEIGTITFNADGTYTCDAIGGEFVREGWFAPGEDFDYTDTPGKYYIIDDCNIMFTSKREGWGGTQNITSIIYPAKVTSTKITKNGSHYTFITKEVD